MFRIPKLKKLIFPTTPSIRWIYLKEKYPSELVTTVYLDKSIPYTDPSGRYDKKILVQVANGELHYVKNSVISKTKSPRFISNLIKDGAK